MNRKNFNIFNLFFVLLIFLSISLLFCKVELAPSSYALFVEANSFNFEIQEETKNLTQSPLTEIYITEITVENKQYDGTTAIVISSIIAKDSSDNVFEGTISAQANTYDANAGDNKLVVFSNFEIVGEEASSYQIAGYNYEPVLVNILPYGYDQAQTLYWEVKDVSASTPVSISPSEYVYTGINQCDGVLAYYFNTNHEREYLLVNIVCNDSPNHHKNEFINAGSYEASVVLMQKEQNYKIADEDGNTKLSLIMKKATPHLIYNVNKTYTYTGVEQSLKSYVSINNEEQTLTFTNDKFTNLNDGKNLTVTVSANATQNYKSISEEFHVPVENFIKRTSNINIDNIETEYKYTGEYQTIQQKNKDVEYLAYIDDNMNSEQELLYSSEKTFLNCEENRKIIIFALETENFNAISKSVYININKGKLSTSNWKWGISIFNYDGLKHSVTINGYDYNLVLIEYANNEKTEAGVYVASASFTLLDPNYEEVSFPNITWRINKAQITKPNLSDRTSTYTGVTQQVDILESMYYNIENNYNKNAGNYKVLISLVDSKNYEWKDGTVNTLSVNWKIEKAKVETPIYSKTLSYTGDNLHIQIPTNELYSIICPEQKEIGSYNAYLFLVDAENYEWKDGEGQPFLVINWSIIDSSYNSSSSIIAIIIVSLVIIGVAIYITLQFTIKARRRRRRKKLVNQEEKPKTESLAVQDETKQPTEVNEPKKQLKESSANNTKTKDINQTTSNLGLVKTRKKRMLSMKKLDKRERRKKENKKNTKLKNTSVKRGRPSKKANNKKGN